MSATTGIRWQTDYWSPAVPKFVVYIGVNSPAGDRVCAYETGVWGPGRLAEAQAFARDALVAATAAEAVLRLPFGVGAWVFEDEAFTKLKPMGVSVESFNEEVGTLHVWSYGTDANGVALTEDYDY